MKTNENAMFELRFKVNKFSHEVVGTYQTRQLAYGMRKKLCAEQPERFTLSKMHVVQI